MNNRPTLLLIDASVLIYQCYNTVGHFSNSQGESTGLRYGFIRAVRSYSANLKAQKTLLCFDTRASSIKAEGIQEYKSNRTQTQEKEKMYSQVPALREMLSLTAYSQVEAPGYEADDLIAYYARRFERQANVIIMSTDADLCQLISESTRVYLPGKKPVFKDRNWVREEWQVWPEHLLLYRAAMGDNSDNLAGVLKGKDQETQLRSILHSLPEHRETAQAQFRQRLENYDQEVVPVMAILADHRELFERNMRVMGLIDPPKEVINLQKGAKAAGALTELFERLEFKSLMAKIPEITGQEAG